MSKTILFLKKYKALAITMGVFWAVWAVWSFMLGLIFNLKMPFELLSQLYFGLLPLSWGGLVLCMIIMFIDMESFWFICSPWSITGRVGVIRNSNREFIRDRNR